MLNDGITLPRINSARIVESRRYATLSDMIPWQDYIRRNCSVNQIGVALNPMTLEESAKETTSSSFCPGGTIESKQREAGVCSQLVTSKDLGRGLRSSSYRQHSLACTARRLALVWCGRQEVMHIFVICCMADMFWGSSHSKDLAPKRFDMASRPNVSWLW
jgi:hypothetical protein